MINPSANVFVFGDFDVHHKDWLTCFGRTDKPGELSYHFSISDDLTQRVNFPTWILDSNVTHSLLFWISFFLLTLVFVLQWLSVHCEILIMLLSPQQDPLFDRIAYDYSHADLDGLCDHLRDILYEDIFKLGASVAASEFCE